MEGRQRYTAAWKDVSWGAWSHAAVHCGMEGRQLGGMGMLHTVCRVVPRGLCRRYTYIRYGLLGGVGIGPGQCLPVGKEEGLRCGLVAPEERIERMHSAKHLTSSSW